MSGLHHVNIYVTFPVCKNCFSALSYVGDMHILCMRVLLFFLQNYRQDQSCSFNQSDLWDGSPDVALDWRVSL